jgi:hypothetical protein
MPARKIAMRNDLIIDKKTAEIEIANKRRTDLLTVSRFMLRMLVPFLRMTHRNFMIEDHLAHLRYHLDADITIIFYIFFCQILLHRMRAFE